MTERSGANSAQKQRGRAFPKGRSGNPQGKPKGARHRASIMAEQLMANDAEHVVRAVVDAAKAGDMTAARIVMDWLCPARKNHPIGFALPPIATAADPASAMGEIVAAVAKGQLTPSDGAEVAKLVEGYAKVLETSELEARIEALESPHRARTGNLSRIKLTQEALVLVRNFGAIIEGSEASDTL